MEPFVIQCTTCRARSRWTYRCGRGHRRLSQMRSFVQVTPPPGWQAPCSACRSASRSSPAVRRRLRRAAPCALAEAAPRAVTDTQTPGDTVRLERKRRRAAVRFNGPPRVPRLPRQRRRLHCPAGRLAAGRSARRQRRPAAGGKRVAAAATGPASRSCPSPPANPASAHWLAAVRQHYWISLGGPLSAAPLIAVAWSRCGQGRNRQPQPTPTVGAGGPTERNSRRTCRRRRDRTGCAFEGRRAVECVDRPRRCSGRYVRRCSTACRESRAGRLRDRTGRYSDPVRRKGRARRSSTRRRGSGQIAADRAARYDRPGAGRRAGTANLDDSSAAGSTGGPCPAGRSTAAEDESGEQFDGVKQARLVRICRTRFRPWNSATCRLTSLWRSSPS